MSELGEESMRKLAFTRQKTSISSVAAKGLLTNHYSSRNASQHSSKPMVAEYSPNVVKDKELSVIRETEKDMF
tara:strand:- start:185 stop:403 length:219 start_codon:yes stop_codon:yes gene_type:complete